MKPPQRPNVSFSVRIMQECYMNAQSPHKLWCNLSLRCSARVRHCLRLLVGVHGGLVCRSIGKADLLSDPFGGTDPLALKYKIISWCGHQRYPMMMELIQLINH